MLARSAPMTLPSRISHAARESLERTALRLMVDIHVGDLFTYEGRVLRVRGISPMSASPRRVLLEDVETGEAVEAPVDELEPYDDGGSAA